MADTNSNPDILLSIGGDPGPLFKQIEALQAEISTLGTNSSVGEVSNALAATGRTADVTKEKVKGLNATFADMATATKKAVGESETALLKLSRLVVSLQSELNKGGISEGLQSQIQAKINEVKLLIEQLRSVGAGGITFDISELKNTSNEFRKLTASMGLFAKGFTDMDAAIAASMGKIA